MYKLTEDEYYQEQAYSDFWISYVEDYKIVMNMTAEEFDREKFPLVKGEK